MFARLLFENDLTSKQFARKTGFDYRSVVHWYKTDKLPEEIREEILAALKIYAHAELQDNWPIKDPLKNLKQRLGHHAVSGNYVGYNRRLRRRDRAKVLRYQFALMPVSKQQEVIDSLNQTVNDWVVLNRHEE